MPGQHMLLETMAVSPIPMANESWLKKTPRCVSAPHHTVETKSEVQGDGSQLETKKTIAALAVKNETWEIRDRLTASKAAAETRGKPRLWVAGLVVEKPPSKPSCCPLGALACELGRVGSSGRPKAGKRGLQTNGPKRQYGQTAIYARQCSSLETRSQSDI